MRSENSSNNILEEESRLYFASICNSFGWKFRDYNKDNDIDGEVEIFSLNDKSKRITNAAYVKIQLKSTKSPVYKNERIKCKVSRKFLHFADLCEQPIILVMYDGLRKISYWIWVQEYIFNVLDKKDWRSKYTDEYIWIPIANIAEQSDDFQSSLCNLADKGISEIQAMKKKDYLEYYFTELNLQDFSIPCQRKLSADIYVDKAISESKSVMRELLVRLNKEYRKNDYYKHEDLKKNHGHKKYVDILHLQFYNDLRQKNDGLPFCMTFWKSPEYNDTTVDSNGDEIIDDIKVSWHKNSFLENLYTGKRMSKSKFVKSLKDSLWESKISYEEIATLVNQYTSDEISLSFLIDKIAKMEDLVDKIYNSYGMGDLPPFDCKDVHQKMIETIDSLQNIVIFTTDEKREEKNKLWGVKTYCKRFEDDYNQVIELFEKIG